MILRHKQLSEYSRHSGVAGSQDLKHEYFLYINICQLITFSVIICNFKIIFHEACVAFPLSELTPHCNGFN